MVEAKKTIRFMLNTFYGTPGANEFHSRTFQNSKNFYSAIQRLQKLSLNNKIIKEKSPLFIFSAGWRSGSTFLQRICTTSDRIIWGEPYAYSEPFQRMRDQVTPFTNLEWPDTHFFASSRSLDSLNQQWIANLYPEISEMLSAHCAYIHYLFEKPALRLGYKSWGIKEVRWNMNTALYLKLIFPEAKFLFLVRNPRNAWDSYKRRGKHWFWSWPDHMVKTPTQFGAIWATLAKEFAELHHLVDGFLVRYEDLKNSDTFNKLQSYLNFNITKPKDISLIGTSKTNYSAYDKDRSIKFVQYIENFQLRLKVKKIADRYGYKL